MQEIINEIESSVLSVQADASFLHGTSFDVAVDNQINDTKVAYVFLDPLTFTGTLSTGIEVYPISLGFIKQDEADSTPQQEDEIIKEMKTLCKLFLQSLYDKNLLVDGVVYQVDDYSIEPMRKLRNVCTGVVCKFNLTTVESC